MKIAELRYIDNLLKEDLDQKRAVRKELDDKAQNFKSMAIKTHMTQDEYVLELEELRKELDKARQEYAQSEAAFLAFREHNFN